MMCGSVCVCSYECLIICKNVQLFKAHLTFQQEIKIHQPKQNFFSLSKMKKKKKDEIAPKPERSPIK